MIDGDLFKAVITFAYCKEPQEDQDVDQTEAAEDIDIEQKSPGFEKNSYLFTKYINNY